MKVVSVASLKGGVGKTTLAGTVAQALALSGHKVLAIDNDSQHNLSSMLTSNVRHPNLRDVLRAPADEAPGLFVQAIGRTAVHDLHAVSADPDLSSADVPDLLFLRRCFERCGLSRFYDHVLIDNAPGMEALQLCAIHASDELFVPTELRQFALDGIAEIEQTLRRRFPSAPSVTRVIPNFYRNTKRQNSFLLALRQLFGGRVTTTVIPQDPIFDELVTDGKVLLLHRLHSKSASCFLGLMHELYQTDEDGVWQRMVANRRRRLAAEARERAQNRGRLRRKRK